LAWKCSEGDSIHGIDEHTGIQLKSMEARIGLKADTDTYGEVDLSNQKNGNVYSMTTVDGKVNTFDFTGSTTCPGPRLYRPIQWQSGLIPTTTNSEKWTDESNNFVYQTHFSSALVNPILESINIEFTAINVAVCSGEGGAFSLLNLLPTNDPPEAGIIIQGSSDFATHDIIGHELLHSHLISNGILDYTNIRNSSLNEAIADMVGTYVESIIQSNGSSIPNIDWVIGDDESSAAAAVDRDLSDPVFKCFEDVEDITSSQHLRSTVLGYWFYLITTGGDQIKDGIQLPALGIEKAIKIVLNSLSNTSSDIDYRDLRDASTRLTFEEFGICSNEAITLTRAWNHIFCNENTIPDNSAPCFWVEGNKVICSEDNLSLIHISEPTRPY